MIVSHKHKFVFIHVPKNAGTSVREILEPYADLRGLYKKTTEWSTPAARAVSVGPINFRTMHSFAEEIKDFFIEGEWNWDEYYKFAVVRNPWDWQVSMYHFMLDKGYHKLQSRPIQLFETFEQFLKDDHDSSTAYSNYLIPKLKTSTQDKWFEDKDGNDIVDAIIRFENFQVDFNNVCKTIGIPYKQIPHRNKSNHQHYIKYYNSTTEALIKKTSEKIIKRFGYEFGK